MTDSPMREREMENKSSFGVFELVEQLRKKHPSYVVFSKTESYDHQKKVYSTRYEIYTPDINHNEFTSLEKFTEFMLKLINSDIFYRTRHKARIDANLEYAREQFRDAQENLLIAENDLESYKEMHAKDSPKKFKGE